MIRDLAYLTLAVTLALTVGKVTRLATAQTPPLAQPGGSAALPRPEAAPPAATPAPAPKPQAVEGTVSEVDPMAQTVAVSSGWFGLFGRTLQVAPDTQIALAGRQAALADLKEGSRVKAVYEIRGGHSVATLIEAAEPTARTP